MLSSVQCAVCCVKRVACSIQCAAYIVQCAVYSVMCAVLCTVDLAHIVHLAVLGVLASHHLLQVHAGLEVVPADSRDDI